MCPGRGLATSLEPEETAQVESEVTEILGAIPSRVWDGRSLPVPVEQIARELYGLRVLMKSGVEMKQAIGRPADQQGEVSGLLFCRIGEIWVNSWEAEQPWGTPRTRFTIGHELGHFVMHQIGTPGIYCRAVGEEHPALDPVPRPIPEVEANTFSAALLMPSDLVRTRLCGEEETDVERVRAEFKVSGKASARRIESIRQLDTRMACGDESGA